MIKSRIRFFMFLETQINICNICLTNISCVARQKVSLISANMENSIVLKKILDICVAARGSVAKRNCQHCREPERVGWNAAHSSHSRQLVIAGLTVRRRLRLSSFTASLTSSWSVLRPPRHKVDTILCIPRPAPAVTSDSRPYGGAARTPGTKILTSPLDGAESKEEIWNRRRDWFDWLLTRLWRQRPEVIYTCQCSLYYSVFVSPPSRPVSARCINLRYQSVHKL